jgi:hypothetical protein
MAQPRPAIPFLFPELFTQMDADPWARLMKDVDHDTEPCYIDHVRYYKRTNGKKHEFVVIDIVHQRTHMVATVLLD